MAIGKGRVNGLVPAFLPDFVGTTTLKRGGRVLRSSNDKYLTEMARVFPEMLLVIPLTCGPSWRPNGPRRDAHRDRAVRLAGL